MKDEKEIRDDEIRIIGNDTPPPQPPVRRLWGWIAFGLATVVLVIVLVLAIWNVREVAQPDAETYFEPQPAPAATEVRAPQQLGQAVDSLADGFTEVRDTTINDIPLRIYIPHNAEMTLHVGRLDKRDTTIVYAAQAADIRRDNRKIVGAFVLRGEPLAWGLSKKGYCAVIDGRITVGVAANSPLFEEATERGGYFFRQYALVDNGRLVENEPKNKSIRRSLCDRGGEIMMIETLSAESFHDFAQALVDLGADHAIYLVGSTSYGWAVDGEGAQHEFGVENSHLPRYTSYIVWRRK
ncbi:hypothetical protein [Alistipes sp.]|uniref:hypothetical protein n=1 Tax=Alistipes sp. TaxID=1872444 RepID=UPI0011DE05E7|nr:hypothetical protein [Alistipes sp.]